MRAVLCLCALLLLVVLSGCGGGGGNAPADEVGTLTGHLNAADAASFNVIVDGQELTARPNADGSFSVPNLPAGTHHVSLVSGSGLVGAHFTVTIEGGGTTDLGSVDPQTGGQIAGIVTRMLDGGGLQPLAGVEVIADPEPIYGIEDGQPLTARHPKQANDLTLRAISDENGSYVIPAVPEGGYVVTVSVPGLVQGMAYVWVSAGITSPADFQLQEAVEPGVATVAGQVLAKVEAGESPLEGALVSIYTDGTWSPVTGEPVGLTAAVLSKALVPKGATNVMPPDYQFTQFLTLTDSAGRYSLNVPAGHLQLNVWGEGYEPAFDSFTAHAGDVLQKNYTVKPWTEYPPPDEPTTN